MITGIYSPPHIVIRGKTLSFWQNQLLTGCVISSTAGNENRDLSGTTVVINPDIFVIPEAPLFPLSKGKPDELTAFTVDRNILWFYLPPGYNPQVPREFSVLMNEEYQVRPLEDPPGAIRSTADPLALEQEVIRYQVWYYTRRKVRLESYGNFHFEGLPEIGQNCVVGPSVSIRGSRTRVGGGTRLHEQVILENARIGRDCTLLPGTLIRDSSVGDRVIIGPYSHVRNQSVVNPGAKVGNFVEIKKTSMGPGSKAMHLSYLGDATIGRDTNIGAGTITCNYDGEKKHPTVIGDRVFVGSGAELVAPLEVKCHSYIAAGSTITDTVPAEALAIARSRQVNKLKWLVKRKEK